MGKVSVLVFSLMVLMSCGRIGVDHHVQGAVKVALDLHQVEKYFRIVCEDEHPDDIAMQDRCVAYKVNDLMTKLNISPSESYHPPSSALGAEYILPTCPTPSPTPSSTPISDNT